MKQKKLKWKHTGKGLYVALEKDIADFEAVQRLPRMNIRVNKDLPKRS